MMFGDLPQEALRFASERHAKQIRKGKKKVPYIMHPFSVGLTLQKAGLRDEVIAAGFLHDTVEDTDTTLEEIGARFGFQVRFIVEQLTEPNKHRALAKVENYDQDSADVKAADITNNIYDTYCSWVEHGDEAFTIFEGGKRKTMQHYLDMCYALVFRVSPSMVYNLKQTQERIFKMCG